MVIIIGVFSREYFTALSSMDNVIVLVRIDGGFEWLDFDQLKEEYFYPLFLKKEIFNLPNEFTIRTEIE